MISDRKNPCRRFQSGVLGLVFSLVCPLAPPAALEAAPAGASNLKDSMDRAKAARDWYFFIAAVNVYPGLESEELINKTLEPVLRTLSPGHEGVYTVSDLRDDHGLWPPHIGLGKNLNDKWSMFLEAGYTAGKVRTKNDRRSILLLPLHTDFEIHRSAVFAGVGLDYFPWGMPEQRDNDGLGDRFSNIRPFLGTRLTWTHATFRAKAKLGLAPLPNFLNLELGDSWTLPSATIVGGFELPLSRDTTLTVNAGYNHFWDQEFDFEGYAFTIQWRRYFMGPSQRDIDGNRSLTRP